MTRAELEHAIRAACEVARDTEVYVFGSQAILSQFPDAPPELRQSAEADIAPKNHPERADDIDAVLGELSVFHSTHGFYVHDLSIETAILPLWLGGSRTVIQNENTRKNRGICVEAHDLAASKLVAFREKDRTFVRTLLIERMIDAERLTEVIRTLPRAVEERDRLASWVELTARESRDSI